MSQESVIFKGTSTGLILVLDPDSGIEEILDAMQQKIIAAGRFFKGAILDVTYRGKDLTKLQEEMIYKLLDSKSGAKIRKLEKEKKETDKNIKDINENKNIKDIKENIDIKDIRENNINIKDAVLDIKENANSKELNTKFFKGTLRSGQKIDFNGHVVILGDINPGAEIIASGNVLVMGLLRGLVHAGCNGDRTAVIAAIRIIPMQLRIADTITRPPEGGETDFFMAYEVAHIKDGNIIIEGVAR